MASATLEWYGRAARMGSYSSLSDAERSAFLRRVVARVGERARVAGRPPVVVFDLDGTLLDNRPRSSAILAELAQHWAETNPAAAAAVSATRPSELAYMFTDNLQQLGIDAALHGEALEFWRARFFHDAYLAHDIEVPGAREFACAMYEAGAVVVYLTGRDLPLMGVGSWSSLRDLGFPIGRVGTELVCKPDARTHDETFKRDVAPGLSRLGDVIAAFDNEPGNCNIFRHVYPACDSVLLATQHAPGAPPLAAGVTCVSDLRLALA